MADARAVVGNLWTQRSDVLVAVGVVVVIMMLLIPLPAVLLDIFMAVNLVISLLIILTVLYTRHALEFSVFPTLLLIATVFGLALNVSSTRLILAKGHDFNGHIVRAFATFVVGTKGVEGYVIGLIIFIIIIAVQFIVITKGATRVAEVAARFTLDALPGKQMAIEAEYNSGLLTEEEATRRKNELQREADFYGSMDGASKFISGNVKIGILITVIQIVGGLIVGMTLHDESWNVALDTYISLSIGDGLVTQLPALLISTATGIIVTRAISDSSFGKDITKQFSSQSRPYIISAAFLVVLSFLPGFPWYVLLPLAGLIGALGLTLTRRQIAEEEKTKTREVADREKAAPAEISPVVPLDPLSLEIGYGLIPLVDKEQGAELLDRITRIRRESALELGLVVPRIRIIDNMRLEPAEYSFKIRGVEVGRGRIKMGHYLAIQPGKATEEIPGEPTQDPAFGLPAVWITEEDREQRRAAGLHRGRPAVHRRHAPHGDHQAVRGGNPRPAGGAVHPGHAEDRLPRRRGRGEKGPGDRRDPEGAPGAARRAGVGAQHGGHPGDARRLRRRHQGHRLPHREGAPGAGAADLPAVLRREEDPARADDRAVPGKEDHRLAAGDEPGHRVRAGPGAAPPVDHDARERGQGGAGAGLPRGGPLLGGGASAGQVQHGEGNPPPRRHLEPRGCPGYHRGVPR